MDRLSELLTMPSQEAFAAMVDDANGAMDEDEGQFADAD